MQINPFRTGPIVVTLVLLALCAAAAINPARSYPLHKDVTATTFWVGEAAGPDNTNIANVASAWDDLWQQHYGGVDDPKGRNGFLPAGFVPKENPFYFALPYGDFSGGKRRADAAKVIPWAVDRAWAIGESMCKNRWIKITRHGKAAAGGDRTCYAQWEDVGPFQTNDPAYVFGTAAPKNQSNRQAGLDLSPAARDYLGAGGMDGVDWQFVEESAVPDGPWKRVVTTSQICWK